MTQPLFLGSEASANPDVEELLRIARELVADGAGEGSISVRHGLRATMTLGKPLETLGPKDFVEVADYDPHGDRVLVMGPVAPHAHAGLHALVLRAKKEIGAIVQVALPDDHPALARLVQAKRGRTTLDHAMSALEALRASPVIRATRTQAMAVGRAPAEALENLRKALAPATG